MAYELTREQEAKIASLAIDHSSVSVAPAEDGSVKVTAGGRAWLLNVDGNATAPVPEDARVGIPVDLLRRMLGEDVVDAALEQAQKAAYPEHALGFALQADTEARIAELLATSDQVRQEILGAGGVA